jgi:hypothetical protein
MKNTGFSRTMDDSPLIVDPIKPGDLVSWRRDDIPFAHCRVVEVNPCGDGRMAARILLPPVDTFSPPLFAFAFITDLEREA